MKKVLSILLSVVMAVTAVIGAAPLVYATPDGTQIPVVHVVGTGSHIVRTNENGETEKLFPFQIPEGYVAEKAEVMLPVFAKAFFTQEWDEFCDVLYEIVSPIFSKMALDNNGEVFIQAKKLLANEQLSIAEISTRLGFCDQFYFSRRFKQKFGETPSSFRKRHPEEFI